MSTATPRGLPKFHQELLAICNDPKIRSLAWRWARDPDLVEDALQAAYCAVVRVANPAAIRDPRAYFCRVLRREVHRLRGQLGATPVEDVTRAADAHHGRPGSNPPTPPPVAEAVSTHLLTKAWLVPFSDRRGDLTASVPGRSADPGRYREMIVTVAERVLCRIIATDVSDADYNTALCTAYPEWFDETGCAENTRHQRFRRAREDVRALLRTIIDRKDLDP